MDGFKDIQKLTLKNLVLRMSLRDLGDKIKYKQEDYNNMTHEELDNLINYYQSVIKEFDESGKYPLFS